MLSSEDNIFKYQALINIDVTKYTFLNRKLARVICNTLEIKSQILIQLKRIKAFNNKKTKQITYNICSYKTVADYSELIASMLITNLSNHDIILSYL